MGFSFPTTSPALPCSPWLLNSGWILSEGNSAVYHKTESIQSFSPKFCEFFSPSTVLQSFLKPQSLIEGVVCTRKSHINPVYKGKGKYANPVSLMRGLVTESAPKYLSPNISEIAAAGSWLLARQNKRETILQGTKGIKNKPKRIISAGKTKWNRADGKHEDVIA